VAVTDQHEDQHVVLPGHDEIIIDGSLIDVVTHTAAIQVGQD